jgi:type II secretory pathway component GspD/PulD (secretin)
MKARRQTHHPQQRCSVANDSLPIEILGNYLSGGDMNKLRLIGVFLLITLFGLSPITMARTQDDKNKKPEDAELDVTVLKQLRGRIFELKYRQPTEIFNVIRPLGSGYKAAMISPNDELHTITVRDFPENIATIEEALKRLDTPQPARTQTSLEVQVSLIEAKREGTSPNIEAPASIKPVLQELQNTLNFKSYRYITTFVNRTREGGDVNNSGVADSFLQVAETKGKATFYNYRLNGIHFVTGDGGVQLIDVRDFRFGASVPLVVGIAANTPSGPVNQFQYKDIGIQTPLTVKDGEIVVVGTTNAGSSDEALIIVVSIKKVK